MPNYYNDITASREALQFAVEQKGADVVNGTLARLIKQHWESSVADPATQRGGTYNEYIEAALAPPSVLCETFLAVMEDR